MTRGTVGAELELTFSFHEDGIPGKFLGASVESVELPEHISAVLWRFLRDLQVADKLMETAAENADEDLDDAACDEAREVEGAA